MSSVSVATPHVAGDRSRLSLIAGEHGPPAVDPKTFRAALAHVPSPVAIVTAAGPSGPLGLAIGSFVSISLDPILVGFFPAESSTTWPAIREVGSFCVNILADDQADICRTFAVSGGPKFDGVAWSPAPSGAPVISDCLAWIDCVLEQETLVGDHSLVVGRVMAVHTAGDAHALVFHRGGYTTTG